MATTPRQFRLTEETLADLDKIAAFLESTTHSKASRADAIRYAACEISREITRNLNSKGDLKKSKKSG